jgi:hypothetical protein
MKLALIYLVCLAVGLGLPGLADQLSRSRDSELRREILTQMTAPQSWSIVMAGSTYTCTQDQPAVPDRPSYRCAIIP